jgi:DNA-binding transcriptional ArsR family regulator
MKQARIEIGQVFRALGDPTRRAILERLGAGPVSISGLAAPLGITPTAVMQHLHVLEAANLARTEKSGRVRICRIEPAGFQLVERWIRERRTEWERRLDRLGALLDELG